MSRRAVIPFPHTRRQPHNKPSKGSNVDFDVYDAKDEESVIQKIDACYLSPMKLLAFIVLSLTIIPILIIKWSTRACRFFLYSYTNIENATHIVVYGPRNNKIVRIA